MKVGNEMCGECTLVSGNLPERKNGAGALFFKETGGDGGDDGGGEGPKIRVLRYTTISISLYFFRPPPYYTGSGITPTSIARDLLILRNEVPRNE